jgi:hypothetical protein
MNKTVLVSLGALALAGWSIGCVVTPAAPPPQTAQPATTTTVIEEVTVPAQPPAELAKGVEEGRPAGFHDGAPEGYWVWHDGASWHLRTTTAHREHRFQGRVWVGKGEVTDVRPSHLELNDRFRRKGNAMFFDFRTKGHEDGFDFRIADGECAHFNLLVDGAGHPDKIDIGASDVHPPHHVFRLCK